LASVLGVIAGATAAFFTLPQAAALIGWDVAAVVFLLVAWVTVWHLDPDLDSW
jgi:hypothetical protein